MYTKLGEDLFENLGGEGAATIPRRIDADRSLPPLLEARRGGWPMTAYCLPDSQRPVRLLHASPDAPFVRPLLTATFDSPASDGLLRLNVALRDGTLDSYTATGPRRTSSSRGFPTAPAVRAMESSQMIRSSGRSSAATARTKQSLCRQAPRPLVVEFVRLCAGRRRRAVAKVNLCLGISPRRAVGRGEIPPPPAPSGKNCLAEA